MSLAQTVVTVYGLFTLIGGIIGYVKAKSNMSLIAGAISGILLLICAMGMASRSVTFYVGVIAISLALGIRFSSTWLQKRKWMPDLIMASLSLLSLIVVTLEMIG